MIKKTTLKEAEKVCKTLNKYSDEPWFVGIAIKHTDMVGFYISIYCLNKNHPAFPISIKGVVITSEIRYFPEAL